MSDTIRPIKRSQSLTPLSREHHEGLLFVWKIRQGMKKGIEAGRIVAFCNWFWETDLKHHFQKEEKAFDKLLHTEHPMLQQMLSEHKTIKDLFSNLSSRSTYEELKFIAKAVNDHIRFEERQLFNEVEKLATPEDLRNIVEEKANSCSAEWKDEFWTYQP
jgi:hypothetical protein